MSSSGQDIETSSVDSPQSHCESPYSSPSQQVPHLAFTLTTLNMSTASQPFLRIVEQPQDHFRFRYKSEMVGTHGCLLGKSQNSSRNKTHPTVELVNYPGRAVIRCRLAQDKNAGEHPHKLLEEEQDRDVSYEVPEQGSYKVGFGGMGIIHTAKKDVPGLLFTKYAHLNSQMSPKELRAYCENEAKKINLNIVRLRFSAHDISTDEEICPPVFSDPIHNMKSASTNDLKICRISKTSGRPRGGDDVFIFVEKVNKKNIKIRFFELSSEGEEVWSAYAHFLESDVHHQYAIAFSTPQYRDPYIVSDVTVYFELQRPQDGRTSDPKEFKYKAEEAFKQQNKKRKANSSYSSINSNNSSLKSVGDVPATVMLQACNGAFDGSHDVDMTAHTTIQSIPQIPIGGGHSPHSDLGDALFINMSANASPAEQHLYNDNPVLTQCNIPLNSLPDFNSTELKQILEHNSDMTAEEKMRFSEADWSKYLESFGSLPEETNSMNFIRNMLISDSGVKKGGTQSSSKASISSQMNVEAKEESEDVKLNIVDKTKGQEKPFYKAEDGQEVKRLVVELVELMRKTPLKKNIVRSKLERLVEKRLSNGDTFLHMSLNSNRQSFEYIVKMAHHLGMTHLLNLQNNHLQTILHLAIVAEAPTLIAFLVSKGCDPMLEDEYGNNAIHYAVMCREDASCLDALLGAIERHRIPHDINASSNEKQTPLHLAVAYKSVEKTRRLLKHGASTSVTDSEGRTPLHVAAKMNYRLVMKELLEYVPNPEIDAVDGRGYTALQILCDGSVHDDTVEMVKMLLEKKADPRTSHQSAWRLARNKPLLRSVMQPYLGDVMDEDDIKSEPEDDVKSEPEDDSGDEYVQAEMCLPELSSYITELSAVLDASGAWRALATRLSLDSMSSWYQNTASPTRTLLNFLKQSDSDLTSRSLALTLEDLGQREAASIIRKYI